MNKLSTDIDVVVIGGGFYGCRLAILATQFFDTVVLLEQEPKLMERASLLNQARIHNGYHYPRSVLTALRSRVNFPRFCREYEDCVVNDFKKIYAIAKHGSKVNAKGFEQFCLRIGASVKEAPKSISNIFNSSLIEKCYEVAEYAFDGVKLRQLIQKQLDDSEVFVQTNTTVQKIENPPSLRDKVLITIQQGEECESLKSTLVLNCTYSNINTVLFNSTQSIVPLTHEITEMVLVSPPPSLKDLGITVMDGAYFSLMAYPPKNLHSFSHVRYTPHIQWTESTSQPFIPSEQLLKKFEKKSCYKYMLNDAQRYIPELKNCTYVESFWVVKTILPKSEIDDSRPILCSRDSVLSNVINVMGGKIDNIYDIEEHLKPLFVKCQKGKS